MDPQPPFANRPVFVPPGGPPQEGPSREIHAAMGTENIFALCAAFYRELEQSSIRPMFPADMVAASRHLAMFLVQITGGPPMFNELRGPPRMRMRHLPFRIDEAARQVWLQAFLRLLDARAAEFSFPPEHLPGFRAFLESFSGWMVNTA